jgi:hypothetical protein
MIDVERVLDARIREDAFDIPARSSRRSLKSAALEWRTVGEADFTLGARPLGG